MPYIMVFTHANFIISCSYPLAYKLFGVILLLDAFGGQIEVLDNLMIDLEEVCEQLDLERRKAAQGLKLSKLRHNRE